MPRSNSGRSCAICSNKAMRESVAQMVMEGVGDAEIARRLGLPGGKAGQNGRINVLRHRQRHILAPARAVAEAAGKDLEVRQERKELIKSAEEGGVQAWLSLEKITADLRATAERLDRCGEAAAAAGSGTVVAALANASIRSVETRAKLGNLPGFVAPAKGGEAGAVQFAVNFIWSGAGGRGPEKIEMTSAGHTIEGEAQRQVVPGLPILGGAMPSEHVIPAPVDGDDEWGDEEDI